MCCSQIIKNSSQTEFHKVKESHKSTAHKTPILFKGESGADAPQPRLDSFMDFSLGDRNQISMTIMIMGQKIPGGNVKLGSDQYYGSDF